MNPAKLLLIEDTPSDATLFCDQIQRQLGNEVEIEWRTRLSDALAWLEAGNVPDQIWLDPGLPDLREQNVGKALATLKGYVPIGELRLISSTIAPALASQAAKHDVPVVEKGNESAQILQIVQDLLSKRSSGATTRVELARVEGAIAKLEYQVEANITRLDKIEEVIDRLSTLAFEVGALKDSMNRLLQQGDKQQIQTKRVEARQAIALGLISGLVSLGVAAITIVAPKLIDKWDAKPAAQLSPSPATSSSHP